MKVNLKIFIYYYIACAACKAIIHFNILYFYLCTYFTREELEKQKAKMHYQKLHAAGKTNEAKADLARLAIIKKQREEAAKRREEEMKGDYFIWMYKLFYK